MIHLSGNSLVYSLLFLVLLAALYGWRAYAGYRRISREAVEDFHYKREHNMVANDVTEGAYRNAYMRVNAPRGALYIGATLALICVLTLPALGVLNWIYVTIWENGARDEAFTPGFLVHSLGIFFMIIMFWALVAYLAARRYHANARFNLDDEIAREMRA